MGLIKRLRAAWELQKYFNTEGQSFTPSSPTAGNVWRYLREDVNQIDTTTLEGQLDAYLKCPPVSTIISKKAQALINGKFWFGNENGKQRTSEGQRIYELLNNPNSFQNKVQFMSMAYTMQQLFGKCYIYGEGVSFGSKTPMLTAKKLYVIPNLNIQAIKQTTEGEKFGYVKTYRVKFNDATYEIPEQSIFIWNDTGVSMEISDMYATGQSRLYPLTHPVTSNAAAYNANNTLLTNMGALGIMTPGSDASGVVPFSPKEQEELQKKFRTNYGALKSQYQMLFSKVPLNYSKISSSIADLQLKETIHDTTRVISEAYNYPMRLLGFAEGATYNNQEQAERSLYSNAIVPEAETLCNFFNSECGIEAAEYRLRVSYSHIDSMQEGEKEMAERKKAYAELLSLLLRDGVITIDEYRQKIKIDEI